MKVQNILDFKNSVREFYKPFYDNSDKAHLIDHADDVCNLALKINKEYSEKLIILSAYIHDIFNKTNRKEHHKLAYKYVIDISDNFLKELSNQELKLVAHAVLEHRGSFKGNYYSKLSEIISAADRGIPNIEQTVIRSMKFNNANAQDVYNHIKDKYSTNGYAKFTNAYKEFFGDELNKFQKKADNITVEQILKVWQEYQT